MLLARVEGSVVATQKHESLRGRRLIICQPMNAGDDAEDAPIVAMDPWGAGLRQKVIVSSDGAAARKIVNDPKSPVRMMITGIVDEPIETAKP